MKFSILIAHFNNAIYFKECFDSLVAQSYPNWEAIILDDCSKEEEKSTIKDIIKEDSRFKYFTNSRNEGVGFTKSKLIQLATGDILGYVDPDDALLPSAIEKSINVFRRNQKTVLTYSRLIFCDKDLKPLASFQSAMQVENNNPYFFNCPIQINHFVCFRKDIYETTEKINSDLKISEDQDLYLKMYEKGDVLFINDTNYLYRTHSGGISQNENKEKSYEYWGKVIWSAMQRRGLTTINGTKIPVTFTSAQEIFNLLKYQNSIPYRIRKNLKIILQSFS